MNKQITPRYYGGGFTHEQMKNLLKKFELVKVIGFDIVPLGERGKVIVDKLKKEELESNKRIEKVGFTGDGKFDDNGR